MRIKRKMGYRKLGVLFLSLVMLLSMFAALGKFNQLGKTDCNVVQ
ncbi:MAG: hypothetical protein N2645_02340 [Clostridia bacterium]|nr:hypothetical protein [Clostridia bacterium]